MNEILAEYCGVCWHVIPTGTPDMAYDCIKCGEDVVSIAILRGQSWEKYQPDFTAPDGYHLLHTKMTENGDIDVFIEWVIDGNKLDKDWCMHNWIAWEKLCLTKKRDLIAEWLRERKA